MLLISREAEIQTRRRFLSSFELVKITRTDLAAPAFCGTTRDTRSSEIWFTACRITQKWLKNAPVQLSYHLALQRRVNKKAKFEATNFSAVTISDIYIQNSLFQLHFSY